MTPAEIAAQESADRAEAFNQQIRILQVAAAAAVGAGGLLTLGTVMHRQHLAREEHVRQLADQKHRMQVAADNLTHARDTAADTKHDAIQKRAQELFVKAVDQLGHDKAAVRVGALHALDDLGQEHKSRRRAVMDVWCAYLRMSPAATSTPKVFIVGAAPAAATEPGPTWPAEELHVRATVQRLIAHHLRPPDKQRKKKNPKATGEFWGVMDMDLTGAHLHDFRLTGCHLGTVRFGGATFSGYARFGGATFAGDARFGGATFAGGALFGEATFAGDTGFGEATFTGYAGFVGATFAGDTGFVGATFTGGAWFGGATFAGDTGFGWATFTGGAEVNFEGARVLRPDRNHAWPAGWRVGAADGGDGRPLERIPDPPPATTEATEPNAG
ncbi:pentapeptide repeat-containing protein [Phytomonospora endophytica]|uniref:Pentapeptide repeat protein n=1 Tax=Phytomonospora endophytica TaxID=714109 RepID=A0A841FU72_9ACTN|nr:pentapeptide repeat-containing protein [Phytomonospora endophytica]MBB6039556.1 hypothetical protein [Phytomonospora endophytica]